MVDQIMTLGINEESDVKGRSKIHNSCEQWLSEVMKSDEASLLLYCVMQCY